MNSHKPLYEEDFDQLVRHTLETKFGSQQPSNRIWKRIREKLMGGNSGSGSIFSLRSSLVAQIAILLLLLTVGGVDGLLESHFSPIIRETASIPVNYASSSQTVAWFTEDLTAIENIELPPSTETAALPVDDRDIRLLDVQLKHQISFQKNRRIVHPLLVPPTDVAPHRNSVEGRALLADANRTSISASEALAFFVAEHPNPGVVR